MSVQTFIQFKETVENSFKKHFPNGVITVSSKSNLNGGGRSIFISATLHGGDEVTIHNDQLQIRAYLYNAVIGEDMREKFNIEYTNSCLAIEPAENSFMAMDMVNIPSRKKTSDVDGILKSLKTVFLKAAKVVDMNRDDIYDLKSVDKKFLEVNL